MSASRHVDMITCVRGRTAASQVAAYIRQAVQRYPAMRDRAVAAVQGRELRYASMCTGVGVAEMVMQNLDVLGCQDRFSCLRVSLGVSEQCLVV